MISPASDCVNIRALDSAAATPLVRETLPRANRRIDHDAGTVADAAPAEPVAAATAAWTDAFTAAIRPA